MQRSSSRSLNITTWILYDFANSFVSITFAVYFAQWVVIDQGFADLAFNAAFIGAALLLLCTAPMVGRLLDTRMRHLPGLRITTAMTAVFYSACALVAVQGLTLAALILFAFGFYSYLLTFTFYTPLLGSIVSSEKRGRVSGFGIAAHYAGQIVILLALLPIATGKISLFGGDARAEVLLPAVIGFVLFALPMLLLFREEKRVPSAPLSLSEEFCTLLRDTRHLVAVPGVALFLLAYFLFNDAILTAANNFSIFVEQVWMVSDVIKTYILLGIFATSALGGICSGLLADRIGHKRTLLFVLAGWVVIFPLLALAPNFTFFVVITTLLGFWFGAHWTVSRSVMVYLAPTQGRSLAFAYFGIVERASAFVGPLAWGLTVGGLTAIAPDNYRAAMLLMTVFVLLGVIALIYVRSDRAV